MNFRRMSICAVAASAWCLYGYWQTGRCIIDTGSQGVACYSVWPSPDRSIGVILLFGFAGLLLSRITTRRTNTPAYLSLLLLLPWLQFNLLTEPYLRLLVVLFQKQKWLLPFMIIAGSIWVSEHNGLRRFRYVRRFFSGNLLPVAAIFCLAFIGSLLVVPHLQLTGDEPHYVKIARSLIDDGDVDIQNQEPGYSKYWPADWCRLHHLNRLADGRLISIHFPGLPALLVLPHLIAGRHGINLFLCLSLALTAGISLKAAGRLAGLQDPETKRSPDVHFLTIGCFAGCPLVFFGFQIYPELLAGLCVSLVVLSVLRDRAVMNELIPAVIAVAVLPWLHIKYALLSAIGCLLIALAAWRTSAIHRVLCAIPLLSYGLLSLFLHDKYNSFLPFKAYSEFVQSTGVIEGSILFGAGFTLVDIRHGILIYAPVYLTGIIGLISLFRTNRSAAIKITLLIVPHLLMTWSHISDRWLGWAPPLRFFIPVLPLFFIPMARFVASPGKDPVRRGFIFSLCLVQFVMGLGFIFQPAWIHQRNLFVEHLKQAGVFMDRIFPLISDHASPEAVFTIAMLYLSILMLIFHVSRRVEKNYQNQFETSSAAFGRYLSVIGGILILGSIMHGVSLKNSEMHRDWNRKTHDTTVLLNEFTTGCPPETVIQDMSAPVHSKPWFDRWIHDARELCAPLPELVPRNEDPLHVIQRLVADDHILKAVVLAESECLENPESIEWLLRLLDLYRARAAWDQVISTINTLQSLPGEKVYTLEELSQIRLAANLSMKKAYESLMTIPHLPSWQKQEFVQKALSYEPSGVHLLGSVIPMKIFPALEAWNVWPE